MKKSNKLLKKGESPKVPINKAIEIAKKKAAKAAPVLESAIVDMQPVNKLVNTSLQFLQKQMESRKIKGDIKRSIAIDVVKRAMPKDVILSNGEKGNSFVSCVKELHKEK